MKTIDAADLVAKLKREDTCQQAWDLAVNAGEAAVQPLADLLADPDFELARAARRGLQRIARHASRPGAEAERAAVASALLLYVDKSRALNARRAVLLLLGEIGGDESVPALAALLLEEPVREHARLALERIPTEKSLRALQAALRTVPEAFRFNLASSLRARGQPIKEYPSQRLVPTKTTTVRVNKPA